jgi:primosomal protein N' (replication factor Y)
MLSAAGRAGRGLSKEKLPGSVFIQTFHPENPIFSWLKAEDIEGFFHTLEDERTAFLYPPFGTFTRLICRATNEKKLNCEVDRVFTLLQELARKSTQKVYLSPPSNLGATRNKKFLEKHILLRSATIPEETKKSDDILEDFFATLPREWTIERNFS